jgi:transglutaminase-like putative cysteine protease
MAKATGTDGSLLPTLPWTLAALTFSIVPHLQYLPAWVTVSYLACAGWRWQIERKRWRLPPAWARIGLALLCFLGVIITYESVSGVGPGSALLAVMAALKLLETRRRRDQFVLLFISVFMIMASLLREQYLWSLPFLALGVVITMTAWLRMSVSQQVSVARSFATATRLIAYAVPLMIVMWAFFPRIATPFWAVPIDTSSATTGLSDRMSPGDISSLSLSNAVAFRVRFEESVPPPQQRYWRGLVLNRFNGRTWSGRESFRMPGALEQIEPDGDPVAYEITLEPTRQHWVLAMDMPLEWTMNNTFMGPQHQLTRVQPVDQRISYNAVSYPAYRVQTGMSRPSQASYLRLPRRSNPDTAQLAQQMRQAAGTDEAYVRSVLSKFRNEEFFYTLEPPALGNNPVDRFLFDTRQGFCEHYASAFAVLMRAAGIPSRIVLGYQGGEVNPLGQYLIVRQADAHAWTEIWLDGRGWIRIDPTAAVAPERIEVGRSGAMFEGIGASWGLTAPSEWMYQLTLTWDAINARWNEWVLGYGPENQEMFMQWLGMEDPDWRKMMLTLIGILIVLVAAISFLLIRRYRPPQRDEAALLYQKFIRKAGLEPSRGETPQHYARRVKSRHLGREQETDQVTACYLAARYGPPRGDTLPRLQAAVREFPAGI